MKTERAIFFRESIRNRKTKRRRRRRRTAARRRTSRRPNRRRRSAAKRSASALCRTRYSSTNRIAARERASPATRRRPTEIVDSTTIWARRQATLERDIRSRRRDRRPIETRRLATVAITFWRWKTFSRRRTRLRSRGYATTIRSHVISDPLLSSAA